MWAPHLVMPITIEPSKPRMCHDEHFLNLWMDAPHLTFDRIMDIPWYVEGNHYQTKLDDKSGYDHFVLTKESRTYFGLCWKALYFVFNTLPFLWSPSAYVYHTSGLGPSHFIRSNNMLLSQYIDDHHVGQMCLLQCYNSNWSNIDLAKAAAFIAPSVLVSCGYFIGLKKSILSPVQVIPFLGFLSDSTKQAFLLPEDKKLKFAALRDFLSQKSSPPRVYKGLLGR